MPGGYGCSRRRETVFSTMFFEGNSTTWLPLMQNVLAGWLGVLLLLMPHDLLADVSFDPVVAGTVIYVQLGFLVLAYMFHRRVRDLCVQLLSLEARYESSLREHEAQLVNLANHLKTANAGCGAALRDEVPLIDQSEEEETRTILRRRLVTANVEPSGEPPAAGPSAASKRRKVAEMAEQGTAPLLIAERLHLRPAEVDLLLRVYLLEQNGSTARSE